MTFVGGDHDGRGPERLMFAAKVRDGGRLSAWKCNFRGSENCLSRKVRVSV